MKNKKPSQRDIALCVETILENTDDVKGAIAGIDEMIEESYDAGHDDGYKEGQKKLRSCNSPINEEKLCIDFVVEKFQECKTLEDFQDTYLELFRRSCNFMV